MRNAIFDEVSNKPHHIISWHRVQAFQSVAIRRIAEAVLLSTPAFERLSSIALRVPGELASMHVFFHKSPVVYVSPHNPGAAVLLDVIAQACAAERGDPILRTEEAPRRTNDLFTDLIANSSLRGEPRALTTDAIELSQGNVVNHDKAFGCALASGESTKSLPATQTLGGSATHFLLLLRADTFVGEAAAELQIELHRALTAGMRPILVRLVDEAAGGAAMDEIIRSTPTNLRLAGLFEPIAIEWHPDPYMQAVSVRLVAHALGAQIKNPPRTRISRVRTSLPLVELDANTEKRSHTAAKHMRAAFAASLAVASGAHRDSHADGPTTELNPQLLVRDPDAVQI